MLGEINEWSESFDTHSITKDQNLIGNRKSGVDNYVGTYWMEGDNKIVIADASDEGIYEFTIHAGKNFIVLEGKMFTGTLTLNVSQKSSKGYDNNRLYILNMI